MQMTTNDVIKLLDTMRLLSPETVWKSQDECRGYLKAIDEIKLILDDVENCPVDTSTNSPSMLYTCEEAVDAIRARLSGDWDNVQLMRLGEFLTKVEDIKRIVDATYPAVF